MGAGAEMQRVEGVSPGWDRRLYFQACRGDLDLVPASLPRWLLGHHCPPTCLKLYRIGQLATAPYHREGPFCRCSPNPASARPSRPTAVCVRHVRRLPIIDGMPDNSDNGAWVPVADAARWLGVSSRTIERRITAGTLQSRIDGGRRLVLVETARHAAPEGVSDMSDSVSVSVAERAQHQAAALAVMSDRLSALAGGRVDELKAEIRLARMVGRAGWAAAALVAILGGVGAVLAAGAVEAARGQAAAAEAVRAVVADQARADGERVARLEATIGRLADELLTATADRYFP